MTGHSEYSSSGAASGEPTNPVSDSNVRDNLWCCEQDCHVHALPISLGGGSPFTSMRAEEIFRQFFGDLDLGSSMFGQEFGASAPHQVQMGLT